MGQEGGMKTDKYGGVEDTIAGHTVELDEGEDVHAPIHFVCHWQGSSIFLTQEDEGEGGKKFSACIQVSPQQARRLRELIDASLQN